MPKKFMMQTSQKRSFLTQFSAYILRHVQQAIGSLGDIWRTPFSSCMTIFVLGISLTLPATLHLLVKNTEAISAQWHSASEITLFLTLSTNEQQAQGLLHRIALYPEIEKVHYISAQQALAEFKKDSGFGTALNYLDSNPLPATIIVTPKERFRQVEAATELLTKLEQERAIEQGKLDLDWLTRLEAIATLIKDMVSSTALLLCLSVVLIIGNTIRLAILNQKSAIAVMKLVGATDAFIQRPFLYAGIWYGIFGGIIATLSVTILIKYISFSLNELTELYQSNFLLTGLTLNEFIILEVFAILLGLLGSFLSVKHYIKQIEPASD